MIHVVGEEETTVNEILARLQRNKEVENRLHGRKSSSEPQDTTQRAD